MATRVCRKCGRTFSNTNTNKNLCAHCRYEQNWDRLLAVDATDTSSVSTFARPTELIIKAEKIVLENGGIQLVIDNDTIKSIDSIKVNGIKFERVK